MSRRLPKITVWRAIFAAILLSGLYATYLRVFYGLGGSTNLSDKFPWGIWIAFDVMCGVGLAAGGFTLVAIVHIFAIERYKPVLRPAILTAFLGYVAGGGRPAVRPGPSRPPLASPGDVEPALGDVRSGLVRHPLHAPCCSWSFCRWCSRNSAGTSPLEWIHRISVPLMILGVLLSTLHQSSLGTLFLIVPEKLYPLWYTPILPLLFYVSAIAVGLAMTIFESWHSSRAFGRALELPLLASLARVLAVVLSVYLWIRFLDLSHRHVLEPARAQSHRNLAVRPGNRPHRWSPPCCCTRRASAWTPASCTPAR